jgi:hypothetical protein
VSNHDETPDDFEDHQEQDPSDLEPDESTSHLAPEGSNGHGYFKAYASAVFPDAVWTGGSDIHASVARGGLVPSADMNLILKSMVANGFFGYIQRVMNKHCPGMEWIISPEDFENLLLLDCHRLAHGQETLETKARLRNPSTGNYFHRVTILEDKNIVGGVRVWLEPVFGGTQVGFRYRLERIIPEGEETQEEAAQRIRARTSQQVLEEVSEAEALKENLKEVEGEPLLVETYVDQKDF